VYLNFITNQTSLWFSVFIDGQALAVIIYQVAVSVHVLLPVLNVVEDKELFVVGG